MALYHTRHDQKKNFQGSSRSSENDIIAYAIKKNIKRVTITPKENQNDNTPSMSREIESQAIPPLVCT